MAGSVLRFLVILLGFSHLMICLNAVPLTRTRSLLSNSQVLITALENNHKGITEETGEEELFNVRMDLEEMDYPGSGANNRHTPHPPLEEKKG